MVGRRVLPIVAAHPCPVRAIDVHSFGSVAFVWSTNDHIVGNDLVQGGRFDRRHQSHAIRVLHKVSEDGSEERGHRHGDRQGGDKLAQDAKRVEEGLVLLERRLGPLGGLFFGKHLGRGQRTLRFCHAGFADLAARALARRRDGGV